MNAVKRILVVAAVAFALVGCAGRDRAVIPAGPGADDRPQAVTLRAVERTLSQAPLPPGSRIASSQEAAGKKPFSLPADPNLVDRHATYVVPLDLHDAPAWFSSHPASGLKQTERGAERDRTGVVSASLGFDGASTAAYDFLAEGVAVYPLDSTHAIVRIDSSAIWLPSTANDRAPTDATAVRVTRVLRAGAAPRTYNLSGAAARKLADTLNRQRAYTGAPMSCAMDHGGYDILHFTAPDGDRSFRVETSGCGLITRTDGGSGRPVLISIDLVPTVDRALAATKH